MSAVLWEKSVISPLVQQDLITPLREENDLRTLALLSSFSPQRELNYSQRNRFYCSCTPVYKILIAAHFENIKGEDYHFSKGSSGKNLWMVKQRSCETWFYRHIIGSKLLYNALGSNLVLVMFYEHCAGKNTKISNHQIH